MFKLETEPIRYKDWYDLKYGDSASKKLFDKGETKFLHTVENNVPAPTMYEGRKVHKIVCLPAVNEETGKRVRGKRVLSLLASIPNAFFPASFPAEERKVADALVDVETWKRFSSAPVWDGRNGWNRTELQILLKEVFGEDVSELQMVIDSPPELGKRNVKIIFYPAADPEAAYRNFRYLVTVTGAVRTPESLTTDEHKYVLEALQEPSVWASKQPVCKGDAYKWGKEAEAWYDSRRASEQDAKNCSFLELMRH